MVRVYTPSYLVSSDQKDPGSRPVNKKLVRTPMSTCKLSMVSLSYKPSYEGIVGRRIVI
jgi:hypothetical protein